LQDNAKGLSPFLMVIALHLMRAKYWIATYGVLEIRWRKIIYLQYRVDFFFGIAKEMA